ncbi:MAG: ComEC/Rec2 family competence protein [Acidaminococcaceae bacterium]
MKKLLVLAMSLLVAIFCIGCGSSETAATSPPTKQAVVTVLDVGQADAILIQAEGKTVLIDAGLAKNSKELVAKLQQRAVGQIDLLIMTHPHADHIGGVPAILANFPVKAVYDSANPETTSKLYQNILRQIDKKKIAFHVLRAPGKIPLGEQVALEVLWPPQTLLQGTDSDLNANSIVLRLVYGDFAMFLTGDARKESEAGILAQHSREQVRAQVLKVGHHTSNTSTSKAWLAAVAPEVAIASYGADNDYHFPNKHTLKRLEQAKVKFYNTADQGDVTVTSDGHTYTVRTAK